MVTPHGDREWTNQGPPHHRGQPARAWRAALSDTADLDWSTECHRGEILRGSPLLLKPNKVEAFPTTVDCDNFKRCVWIHQNLISPSHQKKIRGTSE